MHRFPPPLNLPVVERPTVVAGNVNPPHPPPPNGSVVRRSGVARSSPPLVYVCWFGKSPMWVGGLLVYLPKSAPVSSTIKLAHR